MIVDTTIVIDFLKGKAEAIAFLDELRTAGQLLTHPVVVAEALQGARDQREQRRIDALFARFQLVEVDRGDWLDSLARLRRYSLSHGVGWHDCLLAASARRLDLPVATLIDRDFQCFGNVRVVRPY